MEEKRPTTADLLEAWREATRAALLAERLAALAAEAANDADDSAVASEDLATLAETTADAAARAALRAREVSQRARARANLNRDHHLRNAGEAVMGAKETETEARDRYHDQEADARGGPVQGG